MILEFGVLAAPLTEQLKGIIPFDAARTYQTVSDDIAGLYVEGFLTDREADAAWKRLLKAIQKHINQIRKDSKQ